jgi:hypothetical protein
MDDMDVLQNSVLSSREFIRRWKFGDDFFSCDGTCFLSLFSSSRVALEDLRGEEIIDGRLGRCGRQEGRW